MNKIYFCKAEKLKDLYKDGINLLDRERREKTERYIKEEDSILSFMTGLLLHKILGVSDEKKLLYGRSGKPYLEHGPFFSISHSGDTAVIAVSDGEIGVDIERPRNIDRKIMERCFTDDETEFTGVSPENFVRIWTLKEAVSKFFGEGIGFGFNSFSVLPIEKIHNINGIDIKFFVSKIDDKPLSVAYTDGEGFDLEELFPADII